MDMSHIYSQSFQGTNRICRNNKPKVIIIPSNGTFYNGMSSSYSSTYNHDLEGVLSEEEFKGIVSTLNDTIQSYWPCSPCITFGYICYPFSFLSCFPTSICMHEAESHALDFLDHINSRPKYFDRRIAFHLRKAYCSSHIEISIPYEQWLASNDISQPAKLNAFQSLSSTLTSSSPYKNVCVTSQPTYPPERKKGT